MTGSQALDKEKGWIDQLVLVIGRRNRDLHREKNASLI